MDLEKIKFELAARGVKIGHPLDDKLLSRIEAETKLSIREELVSLYRNFNGFQTCDERSQIFLWPLERVLEYSTISLLIGDEKFYPVGDVLIDSDFLMCSLQIPSSIFLLYERKQLASSMFEFLQKLAKGEFDFLSGQNG